MAPLIALRRDVADEQLVALLRAGDDAAFAAIHDRYRRRLLAYARRFLGGSREDAEDVVQDVFTAAHRALLADEREITLRPWLYRMTRNRCIDTSAASTTATSNWPRTTIMPSAPIRSRG